MTKFYLIIILPLSLNEEVEEHLQSKYQVLIYIDE